MELVYVPTIYHTNQLNVGNIQYIDLIEISAIYMCPFFNDTTGLFWFGKHKATQKKTAAFKGLECPRNAPEGSPKGWGFMKSLKQQNRKKQQAKFLGFLHHWTIEAGFFEFPPCFFDHFMVCFTKKGQQPSICASISSFTVVFSTSSSPKVRNHSAESAWFNSAANNLVLVANMASAPTPAKPRLWWFLSRGMMEGG